MGRKVGSEPLGKLYNGKRVRRRLPTSSKN